MKKIVGMGVCTAFIAVAFTFIGSNTVSALPADTFKGVGCFVRVGDGPADYLSDPTCSRHRVRKDTEDGGLEFYTYQDHGQTPWRPKKAYRNTFELCGDFGGTIGIRCGEATEVVTPSGEYKSTWSIR